MFANGKFLPECHTDSLYLSHRRGKDWFFNFLGLRPVRCICCCQRFYAPRLALRLNFNPDRQK
jgi:hypothetical protein